MKTLVVATRGSRLALAQTNIVIDALKKANPEVNFEIKRITTKGDTQTKAALWQLSGFGFFTRQVEEALLAGEADIAVHSFKDMPTEQTEGLLQRCAKDFSRRIALFLTSLPARSTTYPKGRR